MNATATATVSGGVITGITVTNGGSGYTSAPTISFGIQQTENFTVLYKNTPAGVDTPAYARCVGNPAMQSALNSPTATGQCGYVGLGFDTGTYLRTLAIFDSRDNKTWLPTGQNIYGEKSISGTDLAGYLYARFLHLCTPMDASAGLRFASHIPLFENSTRPRAPRLRAIDEVNFQELCQRPPR